MAFPEVAHISWAFGMMYTEDMMLGCVNGEYGGGEDHMRETHQKCSRTATSTLTSS
jgi:hypothetical protein